MPPPGILPHKRRGDGPLVEPIRPTFDRVVPAPPVAPVRPTFATRDVELTARPGAWQLVQADGRRSELGISTVLGRDPVVPDARPHATPVRFDDPARSLSKTHALIDVEAGRVLLQELNSTNGIVVTTATGIRNEMPAGSRRQLSSGDCIELGEFKLWVVRE